VASDQLLILQTHKMPPATIRMALLVERMLSLHKQLPKADTPHEKTALERRIEATDGQIDGGPALRADGGGDKNR
jgi:hypothetical protein